MKYDITKSVRPKMPKPGKGLEVVQLLLSQASKTMHEPLVPMVFPSLVYTKGTVLFVYKGHICGKN